MKKRFITLPPRERHRWWQVGQRAVLGTLLAGPYWLLARRHGGSGLDLHCQSARIAFDLFRRRAAIPSRNLFFMATWPLDSTRYFELPFALESLASRSVRRYLDVSSPRLLPAVFIRQHPDVEATLINPDKDDLDETARLVRELRIESRCHLYPCVVDDIPAEDASLDAITSMSVVEHIPSDQAAIRRLWALLRPGGMLILSMPCAAAGEEHYLNVDHYGVIQGQGGFTFFQRVYDRPALESGVFAVTGLPRRQVLYGERTPGFLQANLLRKWEDRSYPFWREPYTMAREFRRFERIEDLLGEGVIVMEFVKA